MYTCLIEIISQTASFRDPEFQNFHRTLSLPTPTNIIGLVGAALGLSPPDAQSFFNENHIKIGVAGNSKAKSKDLWKYCNQTKEMWLYHPNTGSSSIIHREFLYDTRLFLVFASDVAEAIEEIAEGFESPKFALTLGSSDSLAKIKAVHQALIIRTQQEVAQCYLEGDVMMEIEKRAQDVFDFSISSVPSLHRLPTAFEYESPYGKRQVSRTRIYSMIQGEAKLNYAVEGVTFQQYFIPLLNL